MQQHPDIGYKAVPHEEMSGYTYTDVDLCISRDSLVLYGVNVEDDGNACVVHLHAGRNATFPVLMAIEALGTQGGWREFPKGIELDNGLFVDLDAHTTSVTIFWRPRREREAG